MLQNVTSNDWKVIVLVSLIWLSIGFVIGWRAKDCPECNIRTIDIPKNAKIIDANTPPDSAWSEWQRRNGTSSPFDRHRDHRSN